MTFLGLSNTRGYIRKWIDTATDGNLFVDFIESSVSEPNSLGKMNVGCIICYQVLTCDIPETPEKIDYSLQKFVGLHRHAAFVPPTQTSNSCNYVLYTAPVKVKRATLKDEEGRRFRMRLAWDKEPWLPNVLELNRACFSGVQRAPDSEVTRVFRSGEAFIVRTSVDELLGFALCESRGPEAHLWSIAVKEGHRGRNLGGYLLDEARQYYQELDYEVITLNVHVDNIPTIHLYERLGFRKVATLNRWFLQDGDGIRMIKELS